MDHLQGEHSRLRTRRFGRALAGLLALSSLAASPAFALDPPRPDFFWPYGTVQSGGANIEPAEQAVLALVGGRVCGQASTAVAQAGPGVPAGDVGKTVYVVDVLADGFGPGQRPGCGQPGSPVLLYFTRSGALAAQRLTFTPGGARYDLALGPRLQFRLQGPMLANDGAP